MSVLRTGLARALACVFVSAAAPGGRSADGPVASDPVFHAFTVGGEKVAGRIKQFAADGDVTLVTAGGAERPLPIATLVKLTRDGGSEPPAPEASVVLFPGGDRLFRTAIGAASETTLDVQSFSLGHLKIPLDAIVGLVLALPTDSDALDGLILKVRNQPRTSEVVWLANGDELKGGFLGLTDRSVDFQPGKDPVKLERPGVVALGFDPALVVYPAPESPFYEMTLSDGSRLGVQGIRVEQGHVVAATRFGVSVRVPIAEVLKLHARAKSLVYLSERDPADVRYVPFVGPTRPFRRDATVEGHPIRLRREEFDRGIGTQSRTLLAYRLEPGDRRFQAQVGLDDRAGPLGSVVFRVFVDKSERFASPAMSARDAPRTIDLDVSGAKLLILITEFGDRGGVRDIADWAEARLVRGTQPASPR